MIKPAVGLGGEFRLVVNGGEKDTGWFSNLILDAGLESIGTADNCILYARIGTGTSAPAVDQTALDAQVAASGQMTNTSCVQEGAPNYAALQTCAYVFAQGAVVGNMAEIGVGRATTGATLFSRARIVDGSGNPTTITLTTIDQLTVYYRLRWFPPLTDTTGELVLSETAYPYTMRVASVGSWLTGSGSSSAGAPSRYTFPAYSCLVHSAGAVIGPITGTPTLAVSGGVSDLHNGVLAYVPESRIRTTPISFNVNTGNNAVGGIGAFLIRFNQYMIFQVVFSTPIPKDNTKTMSFNASLGWARRP